MSKKEDLLQEEQTQDADTANANSPEEEFDAEMHVLTLMSENQELSNRLLRLQADFENFKRRTRSERDELLNYANFELLQKLLPVLDNFQRAVEIKEDQGEKILQGVTMIYRQLQDILSKEGLQEIEAQGQQFDPNLHDAVMQEDSAEHEDNAIMMELQKGYLYRDKLLRPAMVKVCKK